jgi:hypothetical protein
MPGRVVGVVPNEILCELVGSLEAKKRGSRRLTSD